LQVVFSEHEQAAAMDMAEALAEDQTLIQVKIRKSLKILLPISGSK
jgi:hypothetical protein